MRSQEVARRYSKALFKANKGAQQALQAVMDLLDQVPELKALLFSPQFSNPEKRRIVDKLFAGKIEPKLLGFLHLLLRKRRLHYLPDVVPAYHQLLSEEKGLMEAEVVTAIPIAQKKKDQLIALLENAFGKKMTLKETANLKVEGGAVLRVGNYMMDSTIKTRLNRLKQHLLS